MARKGGQDRGLASRTLADGSIRWYVRFSHAGRTLKLGSFHTKSQARALYNKVKAEQALGRFFPERYHAPPAPLVADVLSAHLKTATHKRAYKDEARYCAWWSAWYATKRMDGITAASIEAGRQALMGSGAKGRRTGATVNRYVAWLRHALNTEVQQGRLAQNPCAQVRRIPEPPGPIVQLTEAQEMRLARELSPDDLRIVRLAILTGLRRGELFGLRWEWIDLDHGLITIPATKAGGAQTVPLVGEAADLLRGMTSWQRSAWVFPSPRGANAPRQGQHWYRSVFRSACERAGIPVGRPAGVVFHTLRHTFGSRLAMSGARERDLMEAGRWKSSAMVKRYTHLMPDHVREVMERLSGFGGRVASVASGGHVEGQEGANQIVPETVPDERRTAAD